MYICEYVGTCAYAYMCRGVGMLEYVCECVYIDLGVWRYACTCVYVVVGTCGSMCVFACVCMGLWVH